MLWQRGLCNFSEGMSHAMRVTQDGQVIVESSDKTWSTGEGNGKSFQYSCFKNPTNSMKRQKVMTARLEGVQNITGEEQRAILQKE